MQTISLSSINQTKKHESTSDRYSFIPTTRVIDVLNQSGWFPSRAKQAHVRDESKEGYQRHIIRFRNEAQNKALIVGAEIPEIVVINSHGGASSFQIMLGIYRLVCSNGLTVGNTMSEYRIKHVGYTDNAVQDALIALTQQAPLVLEGIERFKQLQLDAPEQEAFAKSAIAMKFDGNKYSVDPRAVLMPRRYDDKKDDLWTTFNRVQENLIRGGVRQRRVDGSRIRSRAVNSIVEDQRINKGLWMLTEEMARIKMQ